MRLKKFWSMFGSNRKWGGKKIICVDFDGVIHRFSSGFQGMGRISDPPVIGGSVKFDGPDAMHMNMDSIDWLKILLDREDFTVAIYSSRSLSFRGRRAMKKWLIKWGFTKEDLNKLWFPVMKPPAWVIIDDRAMQFNGKFFSCDEIADFEPWYKKG